MNSQLAAGEFVRLKLEGENYADYQIGDLSPTKGLQEHLTCELSSRVPIPLCKYFDRQGECSHNQDCTGAHVLNKERAIFVGGQFDEVPFLECHDNVLMIRNVTCNRQSFQKRWEREEGYMSSSLVATDPEDGIPSTVFGLVEFLNPASALRSLHRCSGQDCHISFWGTNELYLDTLTQLELSLEADPSLSSNAYAEQIRYTPYGQKKHAMMRSKQ
eukprot:TRINITY_DN3096_c4_g1_i1.p1 TRINITY_DN3096_c4_g1~~TRINITY_DN3096_c4_g1_i1.p1  ORF type:complete len:216 (+),score=32.83 TRINITY_DN3096_c4_g1_i1:64-711(+)